MVMSDRRSSSVALTLVKANPQEPVSCLKKALNDYERILSPSERDQFLAQTKPDTTAAINLTTLIDKNSSSRHGQCMGTRLTTFLGSLQQFSATVDTFTSSHPEVAGLVWGGVKLALLAVSNVSSYFDKLSTLFMNLGKTCPRFNEYGRLYPSSPELQAALCEYYAAVIRLCQYSTVTFRKSALSRLSMAIVRPYELEFGPYEKELENLSEEVEKVIGLASRQAQKQDSKIIARLEKKLSRQDKEFKKCLVEAKRRRLEEKRLKILEAFSLYDFQKSYNQIRKDWIPDTSVWVCESEPFQRYMTGPLDSLWCIGRLGSGKSAISACVVAYIIETKPSEDTVSFFFCRFDDQESLKSRTIFGSIARQLARSLPTDTFRDVDYEHIDTSIITKFLKDKLSRTCRHFIVIDGLDECPQAQAREVAVILQSLLESPLQIKIYCSSRPAMMLRLPAESQAPQVINLEAPENQINMARDINHYIQVKKPELKVSVQDIMSTVLDRLHEGAEGMFLWVKIQIEILCKKLSDDEILAALKDLPRDLSQTYDRILDQSINPENRHRGKQIFSWVAIAKRPLTVEEVRQAIATDPQRNTWDEKRLINNIEGAIACCCGDLIFVDEEHRTIHFTHGSVKQYLTLQDVQKSPTYYQVDLEEADAEAGAVCVTYLNSTALGTQIVRATDSNGYLNEIPTTVAHNSLPLGKTVNDIAINFLKRHDRSRKLQDRPLKEASGDNEASRQKFLLNQHSFRPYAENFWLEHTKRRIDPESSPVLWEIWCDLIEGAGRTNNLCSTPWTFRDWKERAENVVTWIVEQDHFSMAQLVLRAQPKFPTFDVEALFELAVERGHKDLLKICLETGDVPPTTVDFALPLAAGSGDLDILNQLLSISADVNARRTSSSKTALQAAASCGHTEVVKRLLEESADVNASACHDDGRTAIQAASGMGHLEIVILLLGANAEINGAAHYDNGRTALQAAAEGGHWLVVGRLLREKAEVNAAPCDRNGRTALQAAAENNHLEVLERLLQADEKAEVNAAAGNYGGRTALQAAAGGGHVRIVERLLEEKAEVNAGASHHGGGRTALQAAAGNGHLEVVQILLHAEEKADVNAVGEPNDGRTAIQAAAEGGHIAVVEALLQQGANVNAAASLINGRTALQAAVAGGHVGLMDLLLSVQADVNAIPSICGGRTALQAAAEGGFLYIVEQLLLAGADVDAPASDTDGKTAIQAASEGGHLAVLEKLQKSEDVLGLRRGAVDGGITYHDYTTTGVEST